MKLFNVILAETVCPAVLTFSSSEMVGNVVWIVFHGDGRAQALEVFKWNLHDERESEFYSEIQQENKNNSRRPFSGAHTHIFLFRSQ